MVTRTQCLARAAFVSIEARNEARKLDKDFRSFAKSFPALIHACGLAQAVAFALAKKHNDYLGDLIEVLKDVGHSRITSPAELRRLVCELDVSAYLRLSRDALDAAGWLKRYVEALAEDH